MIVGKEVYVVVGFFSPSVEVRNKNKNKKIIINETLPSIMSCYVEEAQPTFWVGARNPVSVLSVVEEHTTKLIPRLV
jgi:hypothetical protein